MKAKKIDKDGLLLCELQGKTFEQSAAKTNCSSEIFIRRFMHSNIVNQIDNCSILSTNLQPADILSEVEGQYGESNYGSVKFSSNELFWIGYFYRYFCYTYSISSARAYKIIKPKELRGLFLPYHTMDVSQAIERVLEAKNLLMDEESELQRQYMIFKKYHKAIITSK
ncbi:MAG: antitoxin [Pseudobutyrivibrio sp.]|nr:antitoxin [Pseudobutyrivibrio sp.]